MLSINNQYYNNRQYQCNSNIKNVQFQGKLTSFKQPIKSTGTNSIIDSIIYLINTPKRNKAAKIAAQKAAEEANRIKARNRAIQMEQNQRRYNAEMRAQLVKDEPNRLARIAQREIKYADRIEKFSKMDFGKIDSEHILPQSRPYVMDYNTAMQILPKHPEVFAPAPKKGEYGLQHLAASGYWNGPNGVGAKVRVFLPGADLNYSEQFTLHELGRDRQMDYSNMSDEAFSNTHWGIQKAAVYDDYEFDKKIHLGTVLRFSAPECALNPSRPLGFNIFIEGDHSLQEMEKIRKQLIDSGAWTKQLAFQDDDSMIGVFNEIIKVLNK